MTKTPALDFKLPSGRLNQLFGLAALFLSFAFGPSKTSAQNLSCNFWLHWE